MSTDFTRFSDVHLEKVWEVLVKSQGVFLLNQTLIRHHKDTPPTDDERLRDFYHNWTNSI